MKQIILEVTLFGQEYTIFSYTLFNIVLTPLAFFLTSFLMLRKAGVSKQKAFFFNIYIIIVVIVSSRIVHFVFNMEDYNGFLHLFRLQPVGFYLFGGILLSMTVVITASSIVGLGRWKFLDLISPGIGLGLFFNKIGCFLNGCCFGIPTSLPWGVAFPPGTNAYNYYANYLINKSGEGFLITPDNITVHPVQLYESFGGLLLFFLGLILLKWKVSNGIVFLSVFAFLSTSRIFFHYFRATEGSLESNLLFLVYILVSIIALILLYWRLKKFGESI